MKLHPSILKLEGVGGPKEGRRASITSGAVVVPVLPARAQAQGREVFSFQIDGSAQAPDDAAPEVVSTFEMVFAEFCLNGNAVAAWLWADDQLERLARVALLDQFEQTARAKVYCPLATEIALEAQLLINLANMPAEIAAAMVDHKNMIEKPSDLDAAMKDAALRGKVLPDPLTDREKYPTLEYAVSEPALTDEDRAFLREQNLNVVPIKDGT